jgi:PAS domain S-box-containing protein
MLRHTCPLCGELRHPPLRWLAGLLEAEREAATARYRGLVELSRDAILVHADGKLVYANTAAARLLDAPDANALIGREAPGIVHRDDRELAGERLRLEVKGHGQLGGVRRH